MDFIEGALPENERAHFTSHLDACPECVAFFQTYKETPKISRDCFAVRMPEAVKNAVRQFLRGRCK